MIDLAGKRILITGAANGIGRSIATLAAETGADVLATDVAEDALAGLAEGRIRTERLDVTDQDAIRSLFRREAPFSGLVNAAGYVHHGTVGETDDEEWRRTFAINVDSIFFIIRAALPGMIEAGGGSIVNIASIASSIKGFQFRAAYGASKAAVIGLTKSVAVDYMAQGIRCHAICPGTTDTPSLQGRMRALGEQLGGYDVAQQYFVDRQPMGRLGKPEEIAVFAVLLLSDLADFATGQPYIIDGGILA